MGHLELIQMSNRHVEELQNVYAALTRDAACAYPQLEAEFQRDLNRLKRVVKARGLDLYTVDLPAIGKHFDRCLSEGKWTFSGLPLTGKAAACHEFPRFLRGLFKLVFDDSGNLKEGDAIDVEAILFIRQFLYCAKRIELPCSTAAILQEIEEFVSVDNQLPEPESVWKEEAVTREQFESVYKGFQDPEYGLLARLEASGIGFPVAKLLCENLDAVSRLVTSSLGRYSYQDWDFKHGPGAIADCKGPTVKYQWRNWSNRLEGQFPIADVGFYNYGSWAYNREGFFREYYQGNYDMGGIGSQEPVSYLVAVPKTILKPRLIAAEPSEHMWCQQNLRHYFATRCKETWIGEFVDFHDQSRNQNLCKVGSRTGELLTCDLSSASDRMTCGVVGQVFRRNPGLLCSLQAVRTRFLRQDLHKEIPEIIELRKFSTMGSACTFPVQSIVFLVITLASALTARNVRVRKTKDILSLIGKVAVYGDDIIAPCYSWELLQSALSSLMFKVNASKSYATGRFRESCGVDSFLGVDVTPVYYRGICNNKPESIRSTLDVRNNFHKKFYLFTSRALELTIPCSFAMVSMDSGVEGRKFFQRPHLHDLEQVRWNRSLQRSEVMSSVLSSRSDRSPAYDDCGILQYFTEKPEPTTEWVSGVSGRPRLKIRRGWIPISDIGLATN